MPQWIAAFIEAAENAYGAGSGERLLNWARSVFVDAEEHRSWQAWILMLSYLAGGGDVHNPVADQPPWPADVADRFRSVVQEQMGNEALRRQRSLEAEAIATSLSPAEFSLLDVDETNEPLDVITPAAWAASVTRAYYALKGLELEFTEAEWRALLGWVSRAAPSSPFRLRPADIRLPGAFRRQPQA